MIAVAYRSTIESVEAKVGLKFERIGDKYIQCGPYKVLILEDDEPMPEGDHYHSGGLTPSDDSEMFLCTECEAPIWIKDTPIKGKPICSNCWRTLE